MTIRESIRASIIFYIFLASQLGSGQDISNPPETRMPLNKSLDGLDSNASKDTSWKSYDPKNQSSVGGVEVTKNAVVADIVAPSADYTYAAFGKSSPFVPPLLSNHFAKLEIPIVSMLQRYKLNDLSLVGVWTLENSARKALVMTSENEGVTVQVGDHIGNRGGKIIRIGPSSIKVREFALAPDGSRQFNDRELKLGDDEAEDASKIVIKSDIESGEKEPKKQDRQDFLDTTTWQDNRREVIQKSMAPLEQTSPMNRAKTTKSEQDNVPEITKPALKDLNKNPTLVPAGRK